MGWISDFIKGLLAGEHRLQIQWIIDHADKWRTDGIYSAATYKTEIARRVRYLEADMDSHALELLEAEFPKSHETMQNQMVRFPLMQFIIGKKARAFQGVGARYLLRDKKGDEVDENKPAAKAFSKMLKLSQIELTMPQIEHLVEGCHSCAGRVTWDDSEKRVRVWPYEPTKVHIVPHPINTSDPYSAAVVAFERDGPEGPGGEASFDVFGCRAEDLVAEEIDGLRVFMPSVHYSGTRNELLYSPKDDANPILDRTTRQPIYPMAWFRDKAESIYWKGSDDLVQMNALVNLGLTWLNHNVGWQTAAIPLITHTGQVDLKALDELKARYMAHPKFMMDLPNGCDLKFVAPSVDIQKFLTFYETLIQYLAMMHHLAPKSISLAEGTPQSGRAIELQMVSLAEYREQRVLIYRPQLEHLLDVMISVWNLYAPAVYGSGMLIPSDLVPSWEPGRLDTGPIDAQLLKDKWLPAIEVNAATADHWAAELHQINIEQARKMVDENAKRNAELKRQTTRYPEALVDADQAADGIPVKKDEGDEDPEISPEMKAQQDKLKAAAGKDEEPTEPKEG